MITNNYFSKISNIVVGIFLKFRFEAHTTECSLSKVFDQRRKSSVKFSVQYPACRYKTVTLSKSSWSHFQESGSTCILYVFHGLLYHKCSLIFLQYLIIWCVSINDKVHDLTLTPCKVILCHLL